MAGFRSLRLAARFAPACWLILQTTTAAAQPNDKAAAEALFDQGVRLMKQNSFVDACPKLEESERIDPAVGTLLYLGECYERVGKTASAWATFREAASLATNSAQADRARIASSRAQELEPKLSRLSVELAPEVLAIAGVTVKRGAQRLEPSLYGTSLPVDPAEYRIEVSAPGYETWTTPIKVDAGGAMASVRVPALTKLPEGSSPAAPATTSGAGAASASPLPTQPPQVLTSRRTGQQTVGIVLGGVGVVGIGLGSYFGLSAISKNKDAKTHCQGTLCKDTTGVNLSDTAGRRAVASNIAFALGGGLLAAGVVVYLTGGSSSRERVALVPVLTPEAAAATISGRF